MLFIQVFPSVYSNASDKTEDTEVLILGTIARLAFSISGLDTVLMYLASSSLVSIQNL